jgi:hypothetical protein
MHQRCSTPPNKIFQTLSTTYPNKISFQFIPYLCSLISFSFTQTNFATCGSYQYILQRGQGRAGPGGSSCRGSEATLPGHDKETRIVAGIHQKGLLYRELANAACLCSGGNLSGSRGGELPSLNFEK